MESFSAFNNNNIGNTGAIKFAAKWVPQKRKAKRVKKLLPEISLELIGYPNIEDINAGNKYSVIPRIDINVAANK